MGNSWYKKKNCTCTCLSNISSWIYHRPSVVDILPFIRLDLLGLKGPRRNGRGKSRINGLWKSAAKREGRYRESYECMNIIWREPGAHRVSVERLARHPEQAWKLTWICSKSYFSPRVARFEPSENSTLAFWFGQCIIHGISDDTVRNPLLRITYRQRCCFLLLFVNKYYHP